MLTATWFANTMEDLLTSKLEFEIKDLNDDQINIIQENLPKLNEVRNVQIVKAQIEFMWTQTGQHS